MFGGGQGGLDACVLKEFALAVGKGGGKRCGGGSPMMGSTACKEDIFTTFDRTPAAALKVRVYVGCSGLWWLIQRLLQSSQHASRRVSRLLRCVPQLLPGYSCLVSFSHSAASCDLI